MSAAPFLRCYADADADLQAPMDAAVVMPSVLRGTITAALHSIFAQDFAGRIHVLIGLDALGGDPGLLDGVCAARPSRCVVQVLYPGYSTSTRHGGLHPTWDGGSLRTLLTFLANSRYVAYLDDDNWWHPEHLRRLREGIAQGEWAYTLRWFVHQRTRRPICVDTWESVGPHRGIYNERFGGFVDPNCLMIDKQACPHAAPWWSVPFPVPQGDMMADRMVFAFLRDYHRGVGVEHPTVYYEVDPNDIMHGARLAMMGDAYERAGG
ncbi:MAG: glycosyltransferase family 2 protein [Acidisphaera sp.]|nr:glycosyltransferase family 2 protein [Acidisphaera sp.]